MPSSCVHSVSMDKTCFFYAELAEVSTCDQLSKITHFRDLILKIDNMLFVWKKSMKQRCYKSNHNKHQNNIYDAHCLRSQRFNRQRCALSRPGSERDRERWCGSKPWKTKVFTSQKTWFLGAKNKVFDGFGCSWYNVYIPASPSTDAFVCGLSTGFQGFQKPFSWGVLVLNMLFVGWLVCFSLAYVIVAFPLTWLSFGDVFRWSLLPRGMLYAICKCCVSQQQPAVEDQKNRQSFCQTPEWSPKK